MKFTLTVLTICLCLGANAAQCQERTKAMDSFRSELWQQEFRKPDKKKQQSSGSAFQGRQSGGSSRGLDFDAADDYGGGSLPGQAVLDDLREETPIAEMKIDAVANGEYRSLGGSFRNHASAWQLSKRRSDARDPADAIHMSEGPTMTTYLVGFMACIVVCGALLTGRE